jgi:hypothetical protein
MLITPENIYNEILHEKFFTQTLRGTRKNKKNKLFLLLNIRMREREKEAKEENFFHSFLFFLNGYKL